MKEIISKQMDALLLNTLINSIQYSKTQFVWKDYSGYKASIKKPPEKIPYYMLSNDGKPTIEYCMAFSAPGSYSQRNKIYKCETKDYLEPIIQKAMNKTNITESSLSKNTKFNIRHKVLMKVIQLEKRGRTELLPEDEVKEFEHISSNIANSLHKVYESKGMTGALWLDRLLKDEDWVNHAVGKEFDKLYPTKITSEPAKRAYEKQVSEREAILSKAGGKAPVKIKQKRTAQAKRVGKSLMKADQMMLFGNGDKPINIYEKIPIYTGYKFLQHDNGVRKHNLGIYTYSEAVKFFTPYIGEDIEVSRLPYGYSIRTSRETEALPGAALERKKSSMPVSKKSKKQKLPDWMVKGYTPKEKSIEPKQMILFSGLTEKGKYRIRGKVHLWGMRLYNKYNLPTDPRTKAGKQLQDLSYALADKLIIEYGPNELVIGNKISKKIQNLDWLDDQLAQQFEIMNP